MVESERNIGMLAPFPFPSDRGTPIRAKNLVDIAAERHRVGIFTYHTGNQVRAEYDIHRIPDIPLEVSEAGASWKKLVCDGLLLGTVSATAVRTDFDLFHGHLHEGAFISKIASVVSKDNPPVIYDAHGTLVEEMIETGFLAEESMQRPFWEALERRIERSADHVIAQSKARKDALREGGIPGDDITVIPDFVDTTLFRSIPLDSELAAEHNINRSDEVILYTGTLQDYQGIPDLISAFAEVYQENSKAILLLVGGGDISKYEEQAADCGISNRVRFVGRQPFEKMPSFLSLADVAVGPRRYGKNLPSKLLTYMSAEVPPVTTDIEGVGDVIEHERNGLIVPVNDEIALAHQLLEMLENEDKRRQIGSNARRTVEKEYSKAACADQLHDVYCQVLNA